MWKKENITRLNVCAHDVRHDAIRIVHKMKGVNMENLCHKKKKLVTRSSATRAKAPLYSNSCFLVGICACDAKYSEHNDFNDVQTTLKNKVLS